MYVSFDFKSIGLKKELFLISPTSISFVHVKGIVINLVTQSLILVCSTS